MVIKKIFRKALDDNQSCDEDDKIYFRTNVLELVLQFFSIIATK